MHATTLSQWNRQQLSKVDQQEYEEWLAAEYERLETKSVRELQRNYREAAIKSKQLADELDRKYGVNREYFNRL